MKKEMQIRKHAQTTENAERSKEFTKNMNKNPQMTEKTEKFYR